MKIILSENKNFDFGGLLYFFREAWDDAVDLDVVVGALEEVLLVLLAGLGQERRLSLAAAATLVKIVVGVHKS